MKISVLTMFPAMFGSFLETPLVKRGIDKNITEIEIVDIRTWAKGSYRHIDDSPYGGGNGMILRCDVVLDALSSVRHETSFVCALTPAGHPYKQPLAHELVKKEHLILICGHYEGMDQRIIEQCDLCISMGDYVLSGGELPAMTVIDSLVRLQDGILRQGSINEESFENVLLEYPQYTKPYEYKGMKVPDVLLSGNHALIDAYRHEQSLQITKKYRPDLLELYFEDHENE